MSNTTRLEEHLRTLKASEEKAVKVTNFLQKKLLTGAELMKDFVRAGEIQQKQASRALLHVQLEVTILLLLKAADDATKELTALTKSIVQGQIDSDILSPFHDGELIAISEKNNIPILSFAVLLLEPTKYNCAQIKNNFLCSQLRDDFVWAAKSKIGQCFLCLNFMMLCPLMQMLTFLTAMKNRLGLI